MMTISKLAETLKPFVDFRWLTVERRPYSRFLTVSLFYEKPAWLDNQWVPTNDLCETAGELQVRRSALDLSMYTAGNRVDYKSCITEVRE